MSSKRVCVVVFGPTGAGKSQFINFSLRDLENKTNVVSDSLNSCTTEPKSNILERCGITIDLIDTAGSNDTGNKDIQNLQKVCNFLRTKKQIDYIILLFNYADRLQNDTREYIKTLGNMFTTKEFYTHFCVVFTHLPEKETNKVKETKKKHKEEVANIINNIFEIKKGDKLPDVKVYFVNTEIDEDDDGHKRFDEKSQKTVDVLLEQMKLDISYYNEPINTRNLEITGKSKKLREEEQMRKIKELEEKIKQETLRRQRDEEERLRLQKEIEQNKKNEEERRKKEQELKEKERKMAEEKMRLEQIQKEAQKQLEEKKKMEEKIQQFCEQNRIDVQRLNTLDKVIDGGLEVTKGGLITAGAGLLTFIAGTALTVVCPVAGPFVAAVGTSWMEVGTATAAAGGATAGVSKIIKEIQ